MSGPAERCDQQLDEEIAELRNMLSLVRLSAPLIAVACMRLADRLRHRAERDDDDAAIDEALEFADRALGLLPADDPYRYMALRERALILEQRFRRQRDLVDLDSAIIIWRRLASADQPAPASLIAESTAHLGFVLRLRLGTLVTTADDGTIAAALVETHRTLLAARQALPADSPSLAETCWLLGLCWGDRYEQERDPRCLDHAIAEIGESLRRAPDLSGDRHYALAKALHERARRGRADHRDDNADQIETDLATALRHVRIALHTVDPADPLRVEVLWAAVTIAITQLDTSPEAVRVAEVQAWVDQLLVSDDPRSAESRR